MARLEKTRSAPLYQQLAQLLKEDIQKGIYPQDSQIPTEFELSEQHQLSRSTVRKAIEILVEEGMLIKMHGKGTFVAPPRLQETRPAFASSTKALRSVGEELVSRTLDCSLIDATKREKDFFGQDTGKLLAVRRVRMIHEKPICIETIYFTAKHFFLANESFDGSFYSLLQDKYDIYPSEGYSLFEICYATQEEAQLLHVKKGEALMLIRDYVNDQDGNPLHISKRVHLGDTIKYAISSVAFYSPGENP